VTTAPFDPSTLELWHELRDDPSGWHRMDLETLLQRSGYTEHTREGESVWLAPGLSPVHVRHSWSDVPPSIASRIARRVLQVRPTT
jgi:hypothetical protein